MVIEKVDLPGLIDEWAVLTDESEEVLSGIEPELDDAQQLLGWVIFARCIELHRGGLALIRSGGGPATRVVARALLEAAFTIGAIANDEVWAEKYVLVDELARLKLIRKSEKCERSPLVTMAPTRIEELKAELKAEVEEEGIARLRTERLAEAAGMNDMYQVTYSVLSNTVHTTVRDLDDYLELDENREIIGIRPCDPEVRLLPMLYTLALGFVKAREALQRIFSIDIAELEEREGKVFEILKAVLEIREESD